MYLLLSLILPERIPPFHEVGQTQEVHHLPFSIDQSTENWSISVRAQFVRKKLCCYISVLSNIFLATNITTVYLLHIRATDISEIKYKYCGHIPAGCIGNTKHPNAFALTLIHQIIVFLNLLIWPIRSHLKPVIQPATAGLQEENGVQQRVHNDF